ncbi:MAG: hypothetical protein RBT42_11995 [Aquabacterium sp.]|jgi:hypothetical protein|uniref:hypothetical protein n=1 Tax=Aquabacterium sp. TaxID=1872578 RepID=UPI002A35B2DB|nr:hypothetical protein [Aquabacterium sp.]MDX9844467.1 hypothetical protein [Aquabacterium sp.]
MKQWMRWSAISGAILCVACAPLQQAPLVYSSKLIVGLDVSANGSESPGASINIGVKSVDSAYVPIAVSKALDPIGKRTDEATVTIQAIYAEYGAEDSDRFSRAGTDANKGKIVAYLDAWKNLNEAQTQYNRIKGQQDQAIAKLNQFKSFRIAVTEAQGIVSEGLAAASASAPAETSSNAIVDSLNKRAKSIGADLPQFSITDGSIDFDAGLLKLDSLIASIEADMSSHMNALDAAQQKIDLAKSLADERFAAAAQAANLINTKKRDALSVYGRFDSNGSSATSLGNQSGASANGSVLVGKVFSTGLASQNLTEAVMLEARSKCVTSALAVANALKNDSDKMILFGKLEELCSKRNQESSHSR